jgi:pyruvate-formate lyase
MQYTYDFHKDFLLSQYDNPDWDIESGSDDSVVSFALEEIKNSNLPRILIRAKSIAYILEHARFSYDDRSHFVGMLNHADWFMHLRNSWFTDIKQGVMKEILDKHDAAFNARAYHGDADFGHIAPDWESLLKLGFPGILKRVQKERNQQNLSKDAIVFFEACEIVCKAIIIYLKRYEKTMRQKGLVEIADRLSALSNRAPISLPEAYQLMNIMYLFLTHVEGENLRSLGRLDQLLNPFFCADIESGRHTKEELIEYTKHFFAKLHSYRFSANIPFVLGGTEPDGSDSINEFSHFVIDVYKSMHIYDPKIQIRISNSTPSNFLQKVLLCIREGMNSFVFINDDAAIPALVKNGATLNEARNYLLIGCYEPSISGHEIPCSCNGIINLAKVIEVSLNNGFDTISNKLIGLETGEPDGIATFDDFLDIVAKQYQYFVDCTMEVINAYESVYHKLNPAPLLSSVLPDCLQKGRDVYSGGAKYNNSSINSIGLATAVDSLAVIQQVVFEEKIISLSELAQALNDNWLGHEVLQRYCIMKVPKYGNVNVCVDFLTKWLTDLIATTVNGKPNGRGGVYRSGLFSIDWNIDYGLGTNATPDGRNLGAPLSMNVSPTIGRDTSGITEVIRSVSAIDFTLIPNGSVLDVTLHPTSVRGQDGLNALESLIRAYCALKCFGVHINILNASDLRAAQREPEKYSNLQIRVCGWNANFVNLSATEQEQFILRAEAVNIGG